MNFNRGDQVVHWNYGLGVIIQVDEKKLNGRTLQYYVVKIGDLMIWVPVSEADDNGLRYPTPPGDFEALFSILSSPAQPLPDDPLTRKKQLNDHLKEGRLTSVCRALRDLTFHCVSRKMNANDKVFMEHAQNTLISEWAFSLSISVGQASEHLNRLLNIDIPKAKLPVYRKRIESAWWNNK